MEEIELDIGRQIKTLRLAKGVTQEELAQYLGVSFHGGVIIGLN